MEVDLFRELLAGGGDASTMLLCIFLFRSEMRFKAVEAVIAELGKSVGDLKLSDAIRARMCRLVNDGQRGQKVDT